jgi:hypothetical protein
MLIMLIVKPQLVVAGACQLVLYLEYLRETTHE